MKHRVVVRTANSLADKAASWPWCRAWIQPHRDGSRNTSISDSPRASSGPARAADSARRSASDNQHSPVSQHCTMTKRSATEDDVHCCCR